jgi:hypothetical protein
MNVLLVTGGYRWTVVRVARRAEYMHALEAASVGGDIAPFARFIAQELRAAPETGKRRSHAGVP